jgi:potassium efflux system protein
MQCAEEHPLALKLPAPFTSFDSFSGTELQFTVGTVVADVYTSGKVATELRVSILKSLRENGIELANPQRDVHLKDLGWVKSAAARIIEQRSSGGSDRPAPPAAVEPES